jgi:hypothetical protein
MIKDYLIISGGRFDIDKSAPTYSMSVFRMRFRPIKKSSVSRDTVPFTIFTHPHLQT